MGRGGVRDRPRARRAGPPVRRLLGVPLVPRHGPRVVRGRADRRSHERAVRVREGGPRGASRRRRHLHGRRPGVLRAGWVAHDGVPHAGGRAVRGRHLLPPRAVRRPHAAGQRGVAHPPRRRRRAGPPADGRARPRRPAPTVPRPARLRRARARLRRPEPSVRPRVGRLRGGAEVPLHDGDRAPDAVAPPDVEQHRPRDGDHHPRRHGRRRHVRPPRRWLREVLHRPGVGGPPLREDAVRPGPAHRRVPPRVAGRRHGDVSHRRRVDHRVRAARPPPPRRRLLLRRGRRLRGRRGEVLRVDADRGGRRARARRRPPPWSGGR